MKIVFVSTQTGWGGGENLLAQLIVGAKRAETQTLLAAPRKSAVAEWAASQQGLALLQQPGRGRGLHAAWRLRRWLQTEKPDAVVLNDPHAITWGGVATQGLVVPRVGIRHTSFPVRSAWKHNRLVDRVVCVSEAARQECLNAGVHADRLSVIYAGLDKPNVDADAMDSAKAMMHAASATGERHLLAIGSLLPVKGFDILIRAVAKGISVGEPWRLWIAGEGLEREHLTQLAEDLGVTDHVHFLGFRTDVGALLEAADLLVSASYREGLSLVLIEAMLAGCPVVATPVGGHREALRLEQSYESDVARAFEPGDTEGLVTAIRRSVEPTEANRSRVATARTWAEQAFSTERMTRDYLALCRDAA